MDTVRTKLTIQKGATFRAAWNWVQYPYAVEEVGGVLINKETGRKANAADATQVDLTGCSGRMQVRAKVDSVDVLMELTTVNGGMVLGDADDNVKLYSSDTDTTAIDWKSGVYDVEIVFTSGDVVRFSEGPVVVSPEVTR